MGGLALRDVGRAVTADPASGSAVHVAVGTGALVLALVAALGGAVLALLPAAPAAAPVGTGGPVGAGDRAAARP